MVDYRRAAFSFSRSWNSGITSRANGSPIPIPNDEITEETIAQVEERFRDRYFELDRVKTTDPCRFVKFSVRATGIIVETVANVALNIFENYMSHVARTPFDLPAVQRRKRTMVGELRDKQPEKSSVVRLPCLSPSLCEAEPGYANLATGIGNLLRLTFRPGT